MKTMDCQVKPGNDVRYRSSPSTANRRTGSAMLTRFLGMPIRLV
jgi:hypothetical protein